MIRLSFERKDGSQPREVRVFERAVVTVGREVSAASAQEDAWLLPFPDVSRRQCRFTRTGEVVCVEPLSERSGTFVNGHRIAGVTRLGPGDSIRFGMCQLRVLAEPVAAAVGPARAGEIRDAAPPQRPGAPPRLDPVRAPPSGPSKAAQPPAAPVEPPAEPPMSAVPEDMSPIVAGALRWNELGRPSSALLADPMLLRRGQTWSRGGASLRGDAALVRTYIEASALARRARWQRAGFAAAWSLTATVGGSVTAHVLTDPLTFVRPAGVAGAERPACKGEALKAADGLAQRADAVPDDMSRLMVATLAVDTAEKGHCLARSDAEEKLRRRLAGQHSRVLGQAHSGPVVAAAIEGRGRRAATVGKAGEVWVWDLEGTQGPDELDSRARVVAWSKDAHWLVTGAASGEVVLYDAEPSVPVRKATLAGHRDPITALAIDPAENLLVSADERGTLRAWSLRGGTTGSQLGEPRAAAGQVEVLAFDGKGQKLFTLAGGRVQVWPVGPQKLGEPRALAPEGVTAMAVNRKGDRVLTGDRYGQLFLWTPDHPQLKGRKVWDPFAEPIAAVAFVPDANAVLVVTAGKQMRYFDLGAAHGKGELFQSFRFDPLAEVPSHLLVEQQRALTVGETGAPEVWDLLRKEKKRLFRLDEQMSVTALSASEQGARLITGGRDGVVRVWNLFGEGGRGSHTRSDHRGKIRDIALNPQGTVLASAGEDGAIHVYRIDSEAMPMVLHRLQPRGSVGSLALSSDGGWLAGVSEGEVLVWDISKSPVSPPTSLPHHAVRSARWDGAGATLVTAGYDGRVKEWRAEAGKVLVPAAVDEVVGEEIEALAVSRDHVAIGARAGETQRLLVVRPLGERSERPAPLTTGSAAIGGLVWDPRGVRLAVGFLDGGVETWKSVDGRLVDTQPYRSRSGVVALQFAGTGEVAIGTETGDVIVFDPDRPKVPAQVLPSHRRQVVGVAFGGSAEIVVSAAFDRQVALWRDAEGGARTLELGGHTGSIVRLLADTEGRFAVTGAEDGTVRVWPLQVPGLRRLVCATTGRDLGADVWSQHLTDEKPRPLCPTLSGY